MTYPRLLKIRMADTSNPNTIPKLIPSPKPRLLQILYD